MQRNENNWKQQFEIRIIFVISKYYEIKWKKRNLCEKSFFLKPGMKYVKMFEIRNMPEKYFRLFPAKVTDYSRTFKIVKKS